MNAFNRPLSLVASLALLYIRRIALFAVVTFVTFLQVSAADPAVQSTAEMAAALGRLRSVPLW